MSKHTDKPVEAVAEKLNLSEERPHNDHLADYLNDSITRWMRRHKERKPQATASFDADTNLVMVDLILDGATVAASQSPTLTQALMQNAIQDELER